MAYFMPVFICILLAALVIYIILELKDRLQKPQKISCRLIRRERRKDPHQTLIGRRDKVEYRLIFLPLDAEEEKKNEIPMIVRKEVYRSIPKQVDGLLEKRGSSFLSFQYGDVTIFAHSEEIPFDKSLQEEAVRAKEEKKEHENTEE